MGHKRKAEDKKKQKTGDRKKKSKKDEKKSKKSKKKDKKSSKKKGANPSSVNMKQVRPIVSFAQTPPPSSHRRRHHRKEGGDINSPDDVAVLMGRADDKGKVMVHIQLDSTGNHTIRSFFRGIWESTLKSLQEIRRKKYTLLYIASLLVAICFGGHVWYLIRTYGIPPTSDCSEAVSRFIFSLILTIILSPMAFYIINLKITNLGLGVVWMFLIVSLQYFVAITISKSAVFINVYNRKIQLIKDEAGLGLKHTDAFNEVLDYTYLYYKNLPSNVNPNEANLIFLLEKIGTEKRCCDYEIRRRLKDDATNTFMTYQSFWAAVFREKPVSFRPTYCCSAQTTTNNPCTDNGPSLVTTKCNREDVLNAIKEVIFLCLSYSIIMEAACVGMALVFLYYYSDIQGQDLANEQIPGDFEFLHLNRPHLAGQILEMTEKEKLRRQKKKKRLSRMREMFGLEYIGGQQVYPAPGGPMAIPAGYDQQQYDQAYAQQYDPQQQLLPQQQQQYHPQEQQQQQYPQDQYHQQQQDQNYEQQQFQQPQQYLEQQQFPPPQNYPQDQQQFLQQPQQPYQHQ